MKALGIVGSPRKGGNTEYLMTHALKSLAEEGIDTEIVLLAGRNIGHCKGCYSCQKLHRCVIEDDLAPIFEKMKVSDAIILGSPVYFSAASSLMKAFMDRTGLIARYDNQLFKGKCGGPLVVGRRAGHNAAFGQMNYWFQMLGFFMAGSSYWNIAYGRDKGEVASDKEGLDTVWEFGKSMAQLLKATRG